MFYRNRTNFEIIFYTLQGILTKNKQTYVCNRPGFLFAGFTSSSLLERIVLSGSDFWRLPRPSRSMHFGDVSETNGQKKTRSDHAA